MEIKPINPNLPQKEVLDYASSLLKQGGVVAFPSDSSYGLAVDPTNQKAVKTLFDIKGRLPQNQVSCLFGSIAEVEKWAVVSPTQKQILDHNLPGPFTFLLRPTSAYPLNGETVGVRIADSPVTKALSIAFGQPYTATSANISGQEAAYSAQEVISQFSGRSVQPDLILDAGELPRQLPSAVVDIRFDEPKILREGSERVALPT